MNIKDLKDYTLLDLETKGLVITGESVLEYGCVRVRNNEIVAISRILANQEGGIPVEASNIHGLTKQVLEKEGIDPKEACKKTLDFVGDDVVVGFNCIAFDHPMLEVECNRLNFSRPKIEKWFDVALWYKGLSIGMIYNEKELFFKYSKRVRDIRAKGKFNLNFLIKSLNLENLRDREGFHGAIIDLRMTKFVFDTLKQKYCNE